MALRRSYLRPILDEQKPVSFTMSLNVHLHSHKAANWQGPHNRNILFEKSHPSFEGKDVLLAQSYVRGSGSFYFWATRLHVIISISLRTGSLFPQCLTITFRLITHMVIFRSCMTRLHPAFKQAFFRNLWATYRASATVTWQQLHRYNVHKAFYRHSVSVTSFDFFFFWAAIYQNALYIWFIFVYMKLHPNLLVTYSTQLTARLSHN